MHRLPEKPVHLFLLYFSAFVMVTALNYVAISDQYKAAWVYYSTPVDVPGRVMIGAFKAIWVKFFLPFFAVLSTFVLYVWGPGVIIDVILAVVNVTLFVSGMARINIMHLPFSIIEQTKQSAGKVLKSMLAMAVLSIMGFGHFFCTQFHLGWLKIVFLILSSIMLWLVWSSYAATSWAKIVRSESD
jgi:hypothetical protein